MSSCRHASRGGASDRQARIGLKLAPLRRGFFAQFAHEEPPPPDLVACSAAAASAPGPVALERSKRRRANSMAAGSYVMSASPQARSYYGADRFTRHRYVECATRSTGRAEQARAAQTMVV